MAERALSNERSKDLFGDQVYLVSRQHLKDQELLIDVTEQARAVGFNEADICLTSRVNELCVEWSEQDVLQWGTRLKVTDHFRLRAVLRNALLRRIRKPFSRDMYYRILRMGRHYENQGRPVTMVERLKLHIGPGDGGSIAATIMMADEE